MVVLVSGVVKLLGVVWMGNVTLIRECSVVLLVSVVKEVVGLEVSGGGVMVSAYRYVRRGIGRGVVGRGGGLGVVVVVWLSAGGAESSQRGINPVLVVDGGNTDLAVTGDRQRLLVQTLT